MKQIVSVLMILMFLGGIIPLSEATLVAAPGTIIGLLSERQTQDYILDNGDRYTVALTRVNSAGNKYADFDINRRKYDGLVEYQDRLSRDSVSGYDIGGGNEIIVITIFPQDSQTPARVQFAIAAKQGVRSNAPYISNVQPRLAIPSTAIAVQAKPVPTDTQAYPQPQQPTSSPPLDPCTDQYRACINSVDTSIPGEIEKCVEPYNKCIGYPMSKQGPPVSNQQLCEQQYSKCVKEDPSSPDLLYKCKIMYSQCVGNPMPVCGNGACEKGEEWKTCPSDCKGSYVPPQPAPDCGRTCKDSFSYCMNQAPFRVGQVWAERLNDDSIRLGAKVVDATQVQFPAFNVDIIVSLDGKEMKLTYDPKSGYYYSEQLREGLTGQHKLSAKISRPGLGAVGVNHVIDFSGKLHEWMAPPAVGMFPYASEGKVYTIEKPTADYQVILEKQCSEIYNQCTQGCGYGSVPPVPACEDKCASIPCAKDMVMPITGSVKLRYGETASVSGNGFPQGEKALYISFQDVDDSRCPPNADCIREGQVSARIYAQHGTTEEVRPQKPIDLVLGQPTKYTVDGETLVFTLKELVGSGSKEEYVAVIDVEGAGSGADCKIQYKQCLEKSCKGKPYPAIPPMMPPTEPPAIVCDNSCLSTSLSKCIPIGFRILEKDPMFCGISGMLENQKKPGEAAQNNYECESNAATNGKCLDVQAQISMLQKIWKLFSSIFGGS